LDEVRIVAETGFVTLIQGETGTGKEVIVDWIGQQRLRQHPHFHDSISTLSADAC
jgi:transcriptional regulator with GAF, ATPase, and Fis domain